MHSQTLTLATLNTLPILQAISKNSLAVFQSDLTIDKAIEGVSIAKIKKVDYNAFVRVMDVLLCNLLDSVSVNQKFTQHSIPLIIQSVFKTYYYVSIDEVAYIFQQGIIGKYPKSFNKLDLETIMCWFQLYDTTERTDWVERRNHNESVKVKKEMQESVNVFRDNAKINEIIEDLTGLEKEKDKEANYIKFKNEYFKNSNPTNQF